jgi:CHAT domain-containing protein
MQLYKMKKIIKGGGNTVLILFVIFLIVNIEIVVWHYVDPKSFWDLLWFVTMSISVYGAIGFIIAAIGFVLNYVSGDGKKRGLGNKLRKLISAVGLVLLLIIGYLFFEVPLFLVNKSFSDKYKLITSSEKLISDGKYRRALVKSEKSYAKAVRDTLEISPVWFMQHYIERLPDYRLKMRANYGAALSNYAFCLVATNDDLAKGEAMFVKSIDFFGKHFPERKDFLLYPYQELLQIAINKNDINKIGIYYDKVFSIINELKEEDIDYAIQGLILFSYMAENNGDLVHAMSTRKTAYDLYKQFNKNKKGFTFIFLTLMVSSDYMRVGNIEQAEEYLKKVSKLLRKRRKTEIYSFYLAQKAHIALLNGDLNKFEECIQDQLKIIRRNQGKESIAYGTGLASLGIKYHRERQFEGASEYFSEALAILERQLPTSSLDYKQILYYKGVKDYMKGSLNEADQIMKAAKKELINAINSRFVFFTVEEKEGYVELIDKRFNYMNAIYAAKADSISIAELYNNIVYAKGIALISEQLFKKQLQSIAEGELLTEYEDILKRKEELRLSNLNNQQASSALIYEDEEIKREERDLLLKISSKGVINPFIVDDVNWMDIQKALETNEAAVEIIRVPEQPFFDSKYLYYALLLRDDYNKPEMIRLFAEEEISVLLQAKGSTSTKISTIYSKENLNSLYQLVWTPLLPHLEGIDIVNLSVSGLLHGVSFAALLQDEQREVKLMNSTRILANPERKLLDQSFKTAILFGNINYTKTIEEVEKEESGAVVMRHPLAEEIRNSGFSSLPETKDEIINIAKILANAEYEVQQFQGYEASEEQLRNIVDLNPSVLHIATHGFYYPQKHFDNQATDLGLNVFDQNLKNPFYRTGLLLSGKIIEIQDFKQDGILTAYEISTLNFAETDLVVLSACETGLGDLRGHEGVYGLHRAFKRAGVNRLIVSLWKVPDKSTSMLFQHFYAYYVKGYTVQAALKAAQQEIKKTKGMEDPFYWAAFQLLE